MRGAAVEADKGRAFWREFTRRGAGVEGVWLDGRVTADMAESNAQIGTPEAWEAGLTGKGVTVAVLDSGVDAGHPDLAGRIAQSRSFIPGEEVADRHGHGTHVTSTVGGSGAASDGKEKGVAPGATLAVGKVLDDEGFGSESEIIAGMEWAARDVDADIVSMSLGSTEPSDGTDPMAEAVNTLSRETGALFVIAAGNTGAPSSIGSPGAADAALTVGAVDSADQAAWFTSAGPRYGDNALKPDLSAPGVGILAARSRLAEGSGDYTSMDGTSMATPHIAGVAALLAEEHPDWSGARLKDALMSTSKELDVSAYQLGAGRVSVPAAVGADVTATGSADLGFYSWPYEADEPVTRTVAYTNSSDTDVELKLSVRGAPEGVATLADTSSPCPRTAPPRPRSPGTGPRRRSATRAARSWRPTRAGSPRAHRVRAGQGGRAVHAHGARQGPLRRRDPGRPDRPAAHRGRRPLPGPRRRLRHPEAPARARDVQPVVLPGRARQPRRRLLGLGFLAAPEVVVDRDREITLDGRELREIGADVGRRTETRQLLMEYDRGANGSDLFGAVQVPLTYDSVFAAPTKKVAQGDFEYRTVWRLGKPLLEVKGIDEATVQSGGTLTEGRTRLPLVDVGAVGAGPFPDGVRGKAVLARLTEGTEPAALAQAAQDAGVKVLFVTDDAPGRLMSWWGTDDNADRPLQIATVSAADARRLHRAGRVDMTGTRNTPYVYDLSEGHEGAVPDRDLTYEPGHRDLAVLRTRYHAAEPSSGGEFRYSLTDTFPIGLGFRERIDYPVERTEYVSTGPGQLWHETVTSAGEALEERGGLSRYRGGSRAELNWFKPVWHPYLGTGLGWGQQRAGNRLQFNAPGWGDSGPDHTGFGDVWSEGSGMSQTTSVYLDGEPVDQGPSSAAYVWDAPADEHTYRLVTDTALDAARWPLATKGHAEWTFRSAATPDDRWTFLPLINLSFDVDTDLAGRCAPARSCGSVSAPRTWRAPRTPGSSAAESWRRPTTAGRPGTRSGCAAATGRPPGTGR